MILIINYQASNLNSIINILKRLGIKYKLSENDKDFEECEKLILPGVSNFAYCMKKLMSKNYDKLIKQQVIENKKKILGICSGMQVLGTYSEEGNSNGLNLIQGTIKKMDTKKNIKVPHIGWNKVNFKKNELMEGIEDSSRFYFCHSYYFLPKNNNDIILECDYGFKFACGIKNANIYGIQFHPEKSFDDGSRLLNNFCKIV